MKIPTRHAREFRWWYAYGRAVGYRAEIEGAAPAPREVLAMFRMFSPRVNQDWCWRVFIHAIIRGARDAQRLTGSR